MIHRRAVRRGMRSVTVSGCLAMVFVTATTSPAIIDFFAALGASELHFGLLGGIPLISLAFQYAGAAITNAVRSRKVLFMVFVIAGRLLYLPVAFVPLLFPSIRGNPLIAVLLLFVAFSGTLSNIAGPLWLSWMADLVPARILNTYWSRRQKWMYATWTLSFLSIAGFTLFLPLGIETAFPILCTIGVAAGVADILLFLAVPEPENAMSPRAPFLETVLAPMRHPEYRSFVVFSCAWAASAMFSAAFMQVYALEKLGLTVWETTLIWCAYGFGMAFFSSLWGGLADRHGHRPILQICVACKPLLVLAFLFATPGNALWLLAAAFLFDSAWDAGILIASNGYMLKIAPRRNRSMFVASISGLAGICGGLGAIAGGVFLEMVGPVPVSGLGGSWDAYQLLFAVNLVMRAGCIVLAARIREVRSDAPQQVLYALLGAWPLKFLAFPVGLYRKGSPQERAGAKRAHRRISRQWPSGPAAPGRSRGSPRRRSPRS